MSSTWPPGVVRTVDGPVGVLRKEFSTGEQNEAKLLEYATALRTTWSSARSRWSAPS